MSKSGTRRVRSADVSRIGARVRKKKLSEIGARSDDQVVAAALRTIAQAPNWTTAWNALFGVGGELSQAFTDEHARTQFLASSGYRKISEALDAKREADGDPPTLAADASRAGGNISIRLPRSLHAALLAEAEAEGVSLNQLCVAKLATRLQLGI